MTALLEQRVAGLTRGPLGPRRIGLGIGAVIAACVGLALLALFHHAPRVIKRHGFRLATWDFPAGLFPVRVPLAAQTGYFAFVEEHAEERQPHAIYAPLHVKPFAVQGNSLRQLGEYPLATAAGRVPELTWPDGRVIVFPEQQVPRSPTGVYTWTIAAPGGPADSNPPVFSWRDPLPRGVQFYAGGKLLALDHPFDEADPPARLTVCAPGGFAQLVQTVPAVACTGSATAGNELVPAVLTRSGELLVYDPATERLQAQPDLQPMARTAAQTAQALLPFAISKQLGIFMASREVWLAVAADGTSWQINKVDAEHFMPNGRPRSPWFVLAENVDKLYDRWRTSAQRSHAGERRMKNEILHLHWEGRQAQADQFSMLSAPYVVDADTLGMLDLLYGRITLIRPVRLP